MTVFELKDQHRILSILYQRYSQHANFNKLTPTIPYFKPEEISELLYLKKYYALKLLTALEKRDFVYQLPNDSLNYVITLKGIDAYIQKSLLIEANVIYKATVRILVELLILVIGTIIAFVILAD
jgi:hypothetical protein